MAKDWAYAFYHSRTWKQCRAAFLTSKHWLCQRCLRPASVAHHKKYLTPTNIGDASVTLSWDNLEALCSDCHNNEHHRTVEATRNGLGFDEEGNLVRRYPPPISES